MWESLQNLYASKLFRYKMEYHFGNFLLLINKDSV